MLAVAAGFLAAALVGPADPDADPAPHAGPGPAPDDGDDRPVDRDRRPPALGVHRPGAPDGAPAWLQGPIRGIPIINAYSAYRLSLLALGIAIGVALWLFLNRTRVGMMIRAGVDDRGMLAASGVNVNLVFAITFAIGAGLAGLGGVIGAVELSMVPGEDTRLLLASLIVVIVGGMGSVVGAAIGAAILGLAETYGLAYAPTYSVVFTFVILMSCWRSGRAGSWDGRHERDAQRWARPMSACAVAPGDELRRARGIRPLRCAATVVHWRSAAADARVRGSWLRRGSRRCVPRRLACATSSCSPACSSFPFVATPFITFQIAAQSLALGLIALSLTFLGGYGGMISLAQMTVAGIAGYAVAILGTSSATEISLGWPWWAGGAVCAADRHLCAALIGWLSVRTEGIYTIMITLAIGVAFYYLVLQNYSLFNGFQGLQQGLSAERARRRLARPAAVLFPRACSARWPATSSSLHRALAVRHRAAGHSRQPAAHGVARLQRRRPPRRGLCVGRRSSPPSAACCSSGTTG